MGAMRIVQPPLELSKQIGAWRSLVAHQTGGLGVVGSNPAAPTIFPDTLEPLSICHQMKLDIIDR